MAATSSCVYKSRHDLVLIVSLCFGPPSIPLFCLTSASLATMPATFNVDSQRNVPLREFVATLLEVDGRISGHFAQGEELAAKKAIEEMILYGVAGVDKDRKRMTIELPEEAFDQIDNNDPEQVLADVDSAIGIYESYPLRDSTNVQLIPAPPSYMTLTEDIHIRYDFPQVRTTPVHIKVHSDPPFFVLDIAQRSWNYSPTQSSQCSHLRHRPSHPGPTHVSPALSLRSGVIRSH
jgi:hypothetical protein